MHPPSSIYDPNPLISMVVDFYILRYFGSLDILLQAELIDGYNF